LMNMLYRASVTLGVPMKRVPIPPTRYDPMRPVQAKMAAPAGGPGVGIPPTRFDPGRRLAIQRSAAPKGGNAGGGGGGGGGKKPYVPPHRRNNAKIAGSASKLSGGPASAARQDLKAGEPAQKAVPPQAANAAAGAGQDQRPTEILADKLAPQKLYEHLCSSVAVIGSDKAGANHVAPIVEARGFDCLSFWLKFNNGILYRGKINQDWIRECVNRRKKFLIASNQFVEFAQSWVGRNIQPHHFSGGYFEDVLTTREEILMILSLGYELSGSMLKPPLALVINGQPSG
jgi:hypothetical protein